MLSESEILEMKSDARIAGYAAALRLAKSLLQETIDHHRDPTSEEYNECEDVRCNWCEQAQKVLDHD